MSYKHLTPYKRPSSYLGPDWPDHCAVYGRSRDSDVLEESNFAAMLQALGGETGEADDGQAGVVIVRDSHWAVGWVETLRVHRRRADLCQIADDLLERREQCPVLDEEDFSQREWERAERFWSGCSVRERAEIIRDHGGRHRDGRPYVSLFAARRAELPVHDDDGGIQDYCQR